VAKNSFPGFRISNIPQNMVIFIEKKNRPFVEKIRKENNLLEKTIIIQI